MKAQSKCHSVIVYPDMIGGWYFAEIDGKAIYRFGPFESHKIVTDLMPVLFPEVPVLEVVDPSASNDDVALMILGHAERVGNITKNQVSGEVLA